MGKRERKIEVIRKYIANAGGTWVGYAYGKIPEDKAINACNSYAGAVNYKDILGLIDITIFGNGKKGMIFTERRIYYNNGLMGGLGSVSYEEIYKSNKIPGDICDGTIYNQNAMVEMVSMLANIEGTSVQDTVNSTMDNLEQGIQDIADTIEKGKELFNAIKGLFGE